MTREEAIQVLNMVEAHGLADEAKRMAIESLSAEPTELKQNFELAEPRWIPVSERLPSMSEQVVCCDNQQRVFTSSLTEIASNGMTFFGQHCKVIAWMPLPKPYKERREE